MDAKKHLQWSLSAGIICSSFNSASDVRAQREGHLYLFCGGVERSFSRSDKFSKGSLKQLVNYQDNPKAGGYFGQNNLAEIN